MTIIKEEFWKLCINSAVADNTTKQNVVNDVFAKLTMFYRNKQGTFHQIFDADQITHATGTLEQSNQFQAHDPYPGSLVIYYGVNTLFVPYKDIPYNDQAFRKLTTKAPSTQALTNIPNNKSAANIKDLLKQLCDMTEKGNNA